MSKLKISENLFLEVAELNRLVRFLKTEGYEQLVKSMVKSYGIVSNAENNYYKVTSKVGTSNSIIINPGIAFDSQLRAIKMENSLDMTITNTGMVRWLILQYKSTNFEKGTVAVTADGTIQGTGTAFTEVLRGQPNFPTKVVFNSSTNTEEYEVVSVTNDNSAILSGSFIPETGLRYSVIGAFTPGFEPTEENKRIYEMDSYDISIVDSADAPVLTPDQFILASIEFSGNGMIVTDRRSGYMFNSSTYTTGILPTSDELTSLLRVQRISTNLLELTVEHGYTITNFEIVETTTSTIFRIKAGTSNFLGTGSIPNSLFKNWVLVNKNTLKKVPIDDNTDHDLYISKFDEDIIAGDVSQFIVVPPYQNIEYKTSYSGTNISALPSYHLVSQGSDTNKFLIPVPYGEITIVLRYRLISGDDSTPWQKFSIAEYVNENGEKQMIGDSQFIITVNEPVVELRNYS